jgi:hypothetical protein
MKLFYSYSARDEPFRMELENHLALLKSENLLETWSFRDIDAGADWEREIDARLNDANVILLLISSEFIASRYCWQVELTRAMERADGGEAILIPILIKPCDWQSAPFAKLQILPDGAKPVSSWRSHDHAWTTVVAGLRKRIAGVSAGSQSALPPPAKNLGAAVPRTIPVVVRQVKNTATEHHHVLTQEDDGLMQEIEVIGQDGRTTTHHGSFDPATRTITKPYGRKVYVSPFATVETKPSPPPLAAIALILLIVLAVVGWCTG